MALMVAVGDEVSRPLGLGTDPATTSAPSEFEPIRIALSTDCAQGCCAGADCAGVRQDLARCSSGRSCVACAGKPASKYRLRVGAVHPAEAGRAVLEGYPQGRPELCVRVGASDERCVPTLLTERSEDDWRALPLLASTEDLSSKVSIRLRWKGVKEPLATAARWTSPVAVTPTSLCKGYAVKLATADGELFGSASLFLDDAHYVVLARAAEIAPLRGLGARLVLSGLEAKLYETRALGVEHFALAFGPLDFDAAEKVRWQLLEQRQTPIRVDGLDYVGAPQPLE